MEQWRHQLADLLADDAGPAAELVRTGTLELAGDNTYDLPHVPTWSRGAMMIIGDAAHAPSPSSGQGASMALEDAVVLAQSLRDCVNSGGHPSPGTMFGPTGSPRASRPMSGHGGTGWNGSSLPALGAAAPRFPDPLGRRLQEAALRLVFRYAVTEEKTAWMSGHRIDWDARVA